MIYAIYFIPALVALCFLAAVVFLVRDARRQHKAFETKRADLFRNSLEQYNTEAQKIIDQFNNDLRKISERKP